MIQRLNTLTLFLSPAESWQCLLLVWLTWIPEDRTIWLTYIKSRAGERAGNRTEHTWSKAPGAGLSAKSGYYSGEPLLVPITTYINPYPGENHLALRQEPHSSLPAIMWHEMVLIQVYLKPKMLSQLS
jgi:hypothetical protein